MVPLHIWSIIIFFFNLPAVAMRANTWMVLGVFSYIQVFALIESVIIFIFLVFVNISLPENLFRDRFVAQGTLLFLATFFWLLPIHLSLDIMPVISNYMNYSLFLFIWTALFLVMLIGGSMFLRRFNQIEIQITHFAERIFTLAVIYVVVDLACFLIVFIRVIF
jgi:hypothetical protein